MRFKYTKHSQKRIRQRGLIAELVEETVAHPDRRERSYGERRLAYKRFHDRILTVVYRVENETIVLITAYWLKEGT